MDFKFFLHVIETAEDSLCNIWKLNAQTRLNFPKLFQAAFKSFHACFQKEHAVKILLPS